MCSRRIGGNDNGNCVSTETCPSEIAAANIGDANRFLNDLEQFKSVGSFMRTGVALPNLSRISGADELLARYDMFGNTQTQAQCRPVDSHRPGKIPFTRPPSRL